MFMKIDFEIEIDLMPFFIESSANVKNNNKFAVVEQPEINLCCLSTKWSLEAVVSLIPSSLSRNFGKAD